MVFAESVWVWVCVHRDLVLGFLHLFSDRGVSFASFLPCSCQQGQHVLPFISPCEPRSPRRALHALRHCCCIWKSLAATEQQCFSWERQWRGTEGHSSCHLPANPLFPWPPPPLPSPHFQESGGLCWANSNRQLNKNVQETLPHRLAGAASPFPSLHILEGLSTPCLYLAHRSQGSMSWSGLFGYGEGVLPGLVVWGWKESPSQHRLMVPPFPAAGVVVSPVMFSITRGGAMSGWHRSSPSIPRRLAKLLDVQNLPPGSLSVGRGDTKISLPSALSPFLKHIPQEGQARLREPPGLPGKHGVVPGGFLFVSFLFFFVFWKYCHGDLGEETGFH